ncbi:MAG: inositol monophosphatase family protein [Nanobdellota archaeon]
MENKALSIAREAGNYLLDNFKKDETLFNERAMSKEIVTKYDKVSDKLIIERLNSYFPDHNILTEESGFIEKNSKYTWIVDSLDGTGNFAAGNPFFSVSIALTKDDKPVLGVVYAPFLNEEYVAVKGEGASLNGKPIKVSEINKLEKAYLVTCEGGSKTNQRLAGIYNSIYPCLKDMRKLGSAAIEGGFVSTGRADGYVTLDIDPWDVAAAVLICEEAGGKVTDFKGNLWKPKKSNILMTNGKIHDNLLELLR